MTGQNPRFENTNKQKSDAKNLFACPIPGNRNQLHIKIAHQHVRVISRQFNTGQPVGLTTSTVEETGLSSQGTWKNICSKPTSYDNKCRRDKRSKVGHRSKPRLPPQWTGNAEAHCALKQDTSPFYSKQSLIPYAASARGLHQSNRRLHLAGRARLIIFWTSVSTNSIKKACYLETEEVTSTL